MCVIFLCEHIVNVKDDNDNKGMPYQRHDVKLKL
jgi:hypothetical protein